MHNDSLETFANQASRRCSFLDFLSCRTAAKAQDWVRTGTNLGAQKIRLAAADFKMVGTDPALSSAQQTFNQVLYSDLTNAGIFDMVSKSLAPPAMPGSPQRSTFRSGATRRRMRPWSPSVPSPSRMADDVVFGWLFDAKNSHSPQVLGQQYNEKAGPDTARHIAHEFADAIIARLGGGVNGIAESTIFFVSGRTGNKEIWEMDYDGANQHQVTHLGQSRYRRASLPMEGGSHSMS